MVWLVAAYIAAINLLTFSVFAVDKHRARTDQRRRVPERVLLNLAALGGTPGAMAAQQILRHKTRKEPFGTWLRVIWIGQAVLLAGALLVRNSPASGL